MIDFRSDTLTRPTKGMLDAMMSAEVGDDVFGEDPTIRKLEEKCAEMLGMDAAVFCPSGTMTNQIALRILTRPYQEVICYEGSHIYKYEGGGMMGNSGLSPKLLIGEQGKISAEEISSVINPDDQHFPESRLISLENTVNKGGGSFYTLNEIEPIYNLAKEKGFKMHLDGARLFNAIVEAGDSSKDYGNYFDTISICLSKGLGAPVGSVLVCKSEYERMARRTRKVFGGGMRQAGYLAAAGLYALDHHIDRLKEDHGMATRLGKVLSEQNWVIGLSPVHTNIVIFEVDHRFSAETMLAKLKEAGILGVGFGPHEIRLVTHLDISQEQMDEAENIIKGIKP